VTILIVLLCALAVLGSRRDRTARMPHEVRFQAWMEQQGKVYATQVEYQTRLANFIASTKKIAELNARSQAEGSSATFALNKFSDLSEEEFSVRLGMKGYTPKDLPNVPVFQPGTEAPPNAFDWRTKNGITAVKDQMQCGSCWAFSCTESIESVHMIKENKPVPALSPQQIVDCDHFDGGCNGGDLPTCYQYVKGTKGLETNANYPYTAKDGTCKADPTKEQDPITGFQYVIPRGSTNEQTMATFLAGNSPMSIIVDASSWSSYSSGVLMASQCGHNLDHAVQAVGYDLTGGFWIVRNSWGSNWGEHGFIRLQFGKDTCGMTSEVTVPTI